MQETRQVVRSLSVDSDPATDNSPSDMPPKADAALIEAAVHKMITSDAFCDTLVSKLADRLNLKAVVEEAVAAALKTAHDEIGRLTEVVNTLEDQVAELQDQLEHRTDDLEQYQRRNNIRIFGIQEKKGEDTDKLVLRVVNEQLGVELPLQSIDRSHRVGRPPKPGPDGEVRHRAIIVRFTSYRDRRRVFEAKKALKGSGVAIREDLTVLRQKVFHAAAEKHGVKNTWTLDGRTKWVTGDGDNKTIHTATRLSQVK